MAPIVRALGERGDDLRPVVCVSDQHQEMLAQVLEFFHITPDDRLGVMGTGQSPAQVAARVLERLPFALLPEDFVDHAACASTTLRTQAEFSRARRAGQPRRCHVPSRTSLPALGAARRAARAPLAAAQDLRAELRLTERLTAGKRDSAARNLIEDTILLHFSDHFAGVHFTAVIGERT